MFETAEVGNKVSKEQYSAEEPLLRAQLLQAQREIATSGFSVVVVLTGSEGTGKSEVLNLLLEWMDARGIRTHAVLRPTPEEREHPPLWRFWMALPPTGRMAIFHGSWYGGLLDQFARGKIDAAALEQGLDQLVAFERMIAQENVLLVKIWLHVSQEVLKDRLRRLSNDPLERWHVTKTDVKYLRNYDSYRKAAELLLRKTGTGFAPWNIIEATDRRYRNLTVGRALLQALQQRPEQAKPAKQKKAVRELPKPDAVNVLNQLDQQHEISKEEYDEKLLRQQGRVFRLTTKMRKTQRSLLVLFEGPDAAGKGGAIRRLIHGMDARQYQVQSVSAPTDEERAHPYLWRFWRNLPPRGHITIYDRSWYGRVLVERIEGFCATNDWMRAYGEINEFEQQLTESGVIVVKFWLHISADEQLRRFKDRETTPYKQYKLTEEDWRNRAKWDAYEAAACDMIARTSTQSAPWVLVEADNKEWARLKVLKTVVQRLRAEL